jgi:hypothetical protein
MQKPARSMWHYDTAVLTTHPLGPSAFHTKFIPRVLAIGGWASFTLGR